MISKNRELRVLTMNWYNSRTKRISCIFYLSILNKSAGGQLICLMQTNCPPAQAMNYSLEPWILCKARTTISRFLRPVNLRLWNWTQVVNLFHVCGSIRII